jgi:tRNA threonylcarbamoyladenosine biosynthesis protein TsaE
MPDDQLTLTTHGEEETIALGRRLGAAARPGDLLALIGPLGAGKTRLIKGLAAGLGVTDTRKVVSPSYVLIIEHAAPMPLVHVDAFRLSGGRELQAVGFDELCRSDAVVAVEWADRVADALPDDRLEARLEPTGEQTRRVTLAALGPAGQRWLQSLTDKPA